MSKIQIKTEKVTPFGGIFPIMGAYDRFLGKIVDSTLGFRCKLAGYRYSEILRSLMCVYFCGGSCIEDVSRHLMPYLSQHPTLRTCSSDTILRSIEELTEGNITYVSDQGRPYEFNPAEKLNTLLLNDLIVGVENRDGNANVRFHQRDTLERIFARLEARGLYINRSRMDCGSCSEEIVGTAEKHCRYFYIRANR